MKRLIIVIVGLGLVSGLVGCAGGGSSSVRYSVGVGYGSYYGSHPWGYYPGRPIYVGGGGGGGIPDIPDIPEGPVAAPMPDFGMPDVGAFDF